MGSGTVLVNVEESVMTITLNRPQVLNAVSREMEGELAEAFAEANHDTRIRVCVLTGSGRAFSAGYDIDTETEKDGSPPDPTKATSGEVLGWWQRRNFTELDRLRQMWRLEKPVIAAVNGYCLGGGFWYQLASDISIASDRAVFGQPEVRMISSTTYLFAALAGWKAANRYALTGDHFDAGEALRLGVVNEVVHHSSVLERAQELAQRIALVPEASVRVNKSVTMLGMLASGLESGLLLNGTLNAIVHSSHGPERARLEEARQRGGMREMLRTRDEPFFPEPFGPRSETK